MSEQFRDLVGLGEECEQRMLCHPQSHCVVRIRELFPNVDNKEVQLYILHGCMRFSMYFYGFTKT